MFKKIVVILMASVFLCSGFSLFARSSLSISLTEGSNRLLWYRKFVKWLDTKGWSIQDDEEEEEVPLEELTPFEVEAKQRIFKSPTSMLNAKPIRLTLDDCIRLALRNNAKIQAYEYEIDAARAKREETNTVPFPIFEYNFDSAPVPKDVTRAVNSFFSGELSWFNRLKIGVGIPLYAFGKLKTAQELADKGIEKAVSERQKERAELVSKVRQLYYGVQLAQEMGRILKDAYSRLEDAVKEYERGESRRSPIDILKAKLFLIDLERRISETQEKEYMALESLRVQLGLNPDVAITTYSDRLKPYKTKIRPMEDYLQVAEQERAEMKLLDTAVEASHLKYKLEKKMVSPNVGFGGYFEIGRTTSDIEGVIATDDFQDPFNYTRAGVGFRVDGKFDPHGNAARARKAESEYYKVNLERYIAKEGIRLEVKKAYLDMVREKENVYRAKRAAKLARSLMFMTKSNADLGVGEEREYTDALQLVLLTRGLYYEAIFRYNVALAELDAKCGIIPLYGEEIEGWEER